jgi:tRNA 2-thiouridine synthesizing protein A
LPSEPAIVDARGLRCPLPVLKTEKAIARLASGEALTVLATDPVARIDIPLFCRRHGHGCEVTVDGDVMRFVVVKATG